MPAARPRCLRVEGGVGIERAERREEIRSRSPGDELAQREFDRRSLRRQATQLDGMLKQLRVDHQVRGHTRDGSDTWNVCRSGRSRLAAESDIKLKKPDSMVLCVSSSFVFQMRSTPGWRRKRSGTRPA